jgi:NADPH:quinone reductase-like Zn-dependent oxidoreductase
MKSWQYKAFGGPEQLAMVEGDPPEPKAGEVRIKVAFCGVNPIDLGALRGRFPTLTLPHIPGGEVSGTVESVGAGVADPQPGERVAVAFRLFCGRCYYCLRGREVDCLTYTPGPILPLYGVMTQGGYAEYTIAPATNVLPIPADMPFADACAAALDGTTAYHLLDRAGVTPGDHVLIVGATGGIGAFAVQLAKARGATVWALGRGDEAAERLRDWGAAEVIDRDREDVAARIAEMSSGRGVDVAIDPIGAATWPLSTGALANGGRYATCGILTGAKVELDLGTLYTRQHVIVGSTGGSRGDLAATLAALRKGQVQAPIWRTYPLDGAPEAMRALNEPGRIGKILLEIAGE